MGDRAVTLPVVNVAYLVYFLGVFPTVVGHDFKVENLHLFVYTTQNELVLLDVYNMAAEQPRLEERQNNKSHRHKLAADVGRILVESHRTRARWLPNHIILRNSGGIPACK